MKQNRLAYNREDYLCTRIMHPATTFEDLNLNSSLQKALNEMDFVYPTTIQRNVFPVAMSGKDVLGIAQTGTGKTFAYLLPVLRQWKFSKERFPQILILVPTRELVLQVVDEIKKLGKYLNIVTVGAFGGVNIRPQMDEVNLGLDILVATPGRLIDLAMSGVLKLKSIKKLVIDEVDEMLNLGFRAQLNTIFDLLPERRQNLLFSATLTPEVEELIQKHFRNPEKIEAARTGTPLENIQQSVYEIPNFNTKINLLEWLLQHDKKMNRVLVFTATKKLADDVFERLEKRMGGRAGVIHSNKSQNNRFNTVKQFDEGSMRVLVATDLVARGLDITEVSHVVNFDMPETAESYIHRIGRTGRADRRGIAINFVTPAEKDRQTAVEELMQYSIPVNELPREVEISSELTQDELPVINMKTIQLKLPKHGQGFHEKKEKNKKVNIKVTRKEAMRKKYGKPITRGRKGFDK
ncbi:MAG TPA: DEAD/DEAH box helicase [Flavobacteriales bacterium]|nr:DEAD/DEAH box helicase [Flavobacteriales bacterium]